MINKMKTAEKQLDYINTTCNTKYKSMDKVDWYYISKKTTFVRNFYS